jgi:hypothetical protein
MRAAEAAVYSRAVKFSLMAENREIRRDRAAHKSWVSENWLRYCNIKYEPKSAMGSLARRQGLPMSAVTSFEK